MDEREEWRPKIFYSSGPEQGLPEPFPAPTHLRRKERSSHNRGALYVPGTPTHVGCSAAAAAGGVSNGYLGHHGSLRRQDFYAASSGSGRYLEHRTRSVDRWMIPRISTSGDPKFLWDAGFGDRSRGRSRNVSLKNPLSVSEKIVLFFFLLLSQGTIIPFFFFYHSYDFFFLQREREAHVYHHSFIKICVACCVAFVLLHMILLLKKNALYILFFFFQFTYLTLPYFPLRAIYKIWEDCSGCLSCRVGFLDLWVVAELITPSPFANHFIIKFIYMYENSIRMGPFTLFFFHIQIPVCCLFLDVPSYIYLLGYIAFSDLCLPWVPGYQFKKEEKKKLFGEPPSFIMGRETISTNMMSVAWNGDIYTTSQSIW